MALELRNHDQIVNAAAAIAQQSCPDLTDLSPGSSFRALLEAAAFNSEWQQFLTVAVLRQTRAATSRGEDLDSYFGDFGLTRLGAVPASGAVTFSRFSTTGTALVPLGAIVKTVDGTVSFTVVKDTANPRWDTGLNGYTIAGGVASVTVPVAASTAGASGNVRAGTITMIASAVPGIDAVANAAGFQNGADGEADEAFRARFTNYINTRSQATTGAVEYAVASVQQGLTFKIVQNVDAAGNPSRGTFVIFVDDGTGSPPDALMSAIHTAVQAAAPISVPFFLLPAQVITANVSLTIKAKPGYSKASLIGAVAAAIQDHINTLGVGEPLSFYRLAHVAQDTVEGVQSVDTLLLNGHTENLGGEPNQSVHAGSIAVS